MSVNQKSDVENLLMQGFKKLVLTDPLEKITIKQITDEAGVIRPTFYNHFQDKYEVIERILMQEIFEPAKPLFAMDMMQEAILLIFKNIQKEKEFYQKLCNSEGQNSFPEIVKKAIHQVVYAYIKDRIGTKKTAHAWLTPETISAYYAQSMSFVVLEWLRSKSDIGPEEITKIYHYIATRSMDDIIKELHDGEES